MQYVEKEGRDGKINELRLKKKLSLSELKSKTNMIYMKLLIRIPSCESSQRFVYVEICVYLFLYVYSGSKFFESESFVRFS